MTIFGFALLVSGPDLQSDEAIDAIFEAGCGDSLVSRSSGVQRVDFHREAPSFRAAVTGAIDAVERAVPGAQVRRVIPDDLVTLADIAERTGRTSESVRLLATSARGPGDFPPPAARVDERNRLWLWDEVAAWFTDVLDEPPSTRPDPALAAVNGLLRARTALERLGTEDREAVLRLMPVDAFPPSVREARLAQQVADRVVAGLAAADAGRDAETTPDPARQAIAS